MDTITITTLIATILSLIFAAGAVWNSHVRRKHLSKLEQTEGAEHHVKFKPPPSTPPPAKATMVNEDTGQTMLFRQIRPGGEVESDDPAEEDELYVWE